MSTLPPSNIKQSPEDSLEKKIYNIVDEFKQFIPITNDRNRLGFSLYKYFKGEGDHPEILVKSLKIKIEGITDKELAAKLSNAIDKIK